MSEQVHNHGADWEKFAIDAAMSNRILIFFLRNNPWYELRRIAPPAEVLGILIPDWRALRIGESVEQQIYRTLAAELGTADDAWAEELETDYVDGLTEIDRLNAAAKVMRMASRAAQEDGQ